MRADYDSEGKTLAIELVSVDRLDRDDADTHDQAIVRISHDQPAIIDIIDAPLGIEEPLRAVAARYDLDAGQLIAVGTAALAMPDCYVEVRAVQRA